MYPVAGAGVVQVPKVAAGVAPPSSSMSLSDIDYQMEVLKKFKDMDQPQGVNSNIVQGPVFPRLVFRNPTNCVADWSGASRN